eukprot:sb/3477364/
MAATDVRERENIPFNRLKRELEDNEEKEGQVSDFYCTPCRSCRKLTLFQIDFLLEGAGHASVQSVKRCDETKRENSNPIDLLMKQITNIEVERDRERIERERDRERER